MYQRNDLVRKLRACFDKVHDSVRPEVLESNASKKKKRLLACLED